MLKRKVHSQKFNERYSKEFDFIKKSGKGDSYAFCFVCNADINLSHGGKSDITVHAKTKKHTLNYNSFKNNGQIKQFVSNKNSDDFKSIKAEVLFTNFLLEHNIPIAAADHSSKLFSAMFPNSDEVRNFSCGRTKAGHIIKLIALDSTQKIGAILKNSPFTVATDGSNDSEVQMYPLVVSFFDEKMSQVTSKLLSLPCLEENSTGENIANLILKELRKLNIPLENCVSLGCDNANVMVGKNKGVYAFLKKEQNNLVVFGCLCHLLNLSAEKGSATLPISFDELLIDIYYYFRKSVKRKNAFKKFQSLYSVDERKILKHGVTRWLSLGKCLGRLIDNWQPLLFYFKEECSGLIKPKVQSSHSVSSHSIAKKTSSDSACKRKVSDVNKEGYKKLKLDNPASSKEHCVLKKQIKSNSVKTQEKIKSKHKKTGVKNKILQREERIFLSLSNNLYYALACFLKNVITVFDKYNTLFQSETPRVHKLKCDLESFFMELLHRFVKTDVIKTVKSVFDVKYSDALNHKTNDQITIGSQTIECLKELSPSDTELFFAHVKKYFMTSCDYVIANFPIHSELLQNAQVADISKKDCATFSSVKYFINFFPCFLMKDDTETVFDAIDKIETEFLHYQTADIPERVLMLERVDEQWAMLAQEVGPLGQQMYKKLSRVMLGILTFPHSNAACERLFSIVRRNKTDFRSSMNLSTLQAILMAKSQISGSCYTQEYDKDFLKKAKSATTVGLCKDAE